MEQLLNGSMMGQQPYESNHPSKMQQHTGTRRMSRAIGIIPARLEKGRLVDILTSVYSCSITFYKGYVIR